MSILDKAKNQLQSRLKGFGEETIRVMDAVEEEKPERAAKEPKQKAPKPASVKTQREKVEKPVRNRNKIVSRPARKPKEVKPKAEKVREEPKQEVNEEVDPIEEENQGSSAFEVDEEQNNFLKNMADKHKKKMKEYESVPVPIPDEGKIQDILEILNIPATFEIENDIFLPDDLDDVAFDLQVPQGYEMGEVDTFVSRVKISVDKFVELLTVRNEHVAKLATVVDRLQVDVSNIKLQSEIANGINIMPTNDDEDYEQANFELKLIIRRLEEQLENQNSDDKLSSEERDTFDRLQDELSVKTREIKDLEDEVYELKNQLAMAEEGNDFDTSINSDDGYSAFDTNEKVSDNYDESLGMYIEGANDNNDSANDSLNNYDESNPGDELYNLTDDNTYDQNIGEVSPSLPNFDESDNNEQSYDNFDDTVNQGVGFVDNQVHSDGAYIDNDQTYNDPIDFNSDDNDFSADLGNFGEDEQIFDNDSDSIDFDFSSDISDGASEELPDVDFDNDEEPVIAQQQRPRGQGNTAFYNDDESINDFMVRNQEYYNGSDEENNSAIEFVDDNGQPYPSSGPVGTYYDPDEEEDELDKLQNWGNK